VTERALQTDGDDASLVAELESLRRALGNLGTDGAAPGQALAIFRLLHGLKLEQWAEVAKSLNLRQWIPLPVEGSLVPSVVHLQHTLEELSFLTDHDPLTGLSNRRAFERGLDLEIERAGRSNTTLSLALLDLDDFKAVNDTFGHPCGDQVLVAVADAMEEFALILPGAGLMEVQTVIDRLHEAVRALRVDCGAGRPITTTCSVGVATYRGRLPVSVPEIMTMADRALYQAKGQGKNRTIVLPVHDLAASLKTTLVQSSEKKFLFTGS
jgi:diguanylate cyclase (GGDEF)-like protein